MPSDIDLLRHYANDHSNEAFSELVRRHIDLVYSSALRRVGMDAHLAEDVTQDVFAELARRSAALLGRTSLEGWLYTTSRFKAIDVVRQSVRRRLRETLMMNANQAADTERPEWERLRPLIDEALDSLSKADGEILVLRYFKNRSFVDLAHSLSLSEDAARMRSARALERLRAALAKRGIRSTAEALGAVLSNNAIAGAPLGLSAKVAERAVALAKGSTSATATALHFMNGMKVAAGVATLALLLASVATAVHEVRAHRAAAEELAKVERENAAATARLRKDTEDLKSELEDEARIKSAVETTLAAIDRAKAMRTGANDKTALGKDFSAKNPDSGPLIAAHDRARNAQKYAALFGSLGLSPEKQAQFLNLLSQRQDLGLTWYSAPDTGTPSATVVAGTDSLSLDEVTAQLRNLLGDDGFKAYQDFGRAGEAQALAQRLAASLYATDTPISKAQGTQLIQILAQSSPDYQSGKTLWNVSQVGWDTAFSNAQAILSAPQMDALRALKQTSEFEQTINAATNQAAGQAVDSLAASLAAEGKGPK
jgi:RNA polymerase sigma factor (sigma-70 family)